MAANGNSNPPVKNQEFTFPITLLDMVNPGKLKTNPTIASGDFKIIKDGGSAANLDTLPTVTPAGGVRVEVYASATEMNANNVLIYWEDQTNPPEWASGSQAILTTSA